MTSSENYGGGWSGCRKTDGITRGRVGQHLGPSSSIIFTSCHIRLMSSFFRIFLFLSISISVVKAVKCVKGVNGRLIPSNIDLGASRRQGQSENVRFLFRVEGRL